MDAAPSQPVEQPLAAQTSGAQSGMHPALLDDLWRECGAGVWGLERSEFDRIVLVAAMAQNFGLESGLQSGAITSKDQQAAFFRAVKLADLVLAKACAAGNERAWEYFVSLYGQQLTRAAIAISGSETVGRDLANAFYAELYGLSTRDGERRCPLDSYRGRGSLLGWLRTTLAQRFVDHYRRTFREKELDDELHDVPAPDPVPDPEPTLLATLRQAVHAALRDQPAEERFLLAAYYVDERTLAEIGMLLNVHEATISRRLRRATESARRQILRNLEKNGMSRKAAEEVLGIDPRDLDLKMDLRKLLQSPPPEPFQEQTTREQAVQDQAAREQAIADPAAAQAPLARAPLSDKAKTAG